MLLGLLRTPISLCVGDPEGSIRLWSDLGKKLWSTLAVTEYPNAEWLKKEVHLTGCEPRVLNDLALMSPDGPSQEECLSLYPHAAEGTISSIFFHFSFYV